MPETIELSVVSPVHNEGGNAGALAREIAKALEGRSFEIIFVDDASRDSTRQELAAARAEIPQLRIISHRRNAGQSRAIRSGVLAARAPLIGTLDGDGQNDPADLPRLVAKLTRGDAPKTAKRAGKPRKSPMPCGCAFWATAPRIPAAASRCFGAKPSFLCRISIICTVTCPL